MKRRIRVLIVDDSLIVRTMLAKVLREDDDFEVVGFANNGQEALEQLEKCLPDVMTLDIEMPVMDGLQVLDAMRNRTNIPVVVLSSQTEHGASVTLEALARGAVDYICKPTHLTDARQGVVFLQTELLTRLRAVCAKRLGNNSDFDMGAMTEQLGADGIVKRKQTQEQRIDIIVIGASVGGPNALSSLLTQLEAPLPVPILIAQHMPPLFTQLFANRLAQLCPGAVVEATDGTSPKPGVIYISPGGCHLWCERKGHLIRLRLTSTPTPEIPWRPSVDMLFRSVAETYGGGVLALVLSGMGNDGQQGAAAIGRAGGQVLVQDRESALVWGMPGLVLASGWSEAPLSLDALRQAMIRRSSRQHRIELPHEA